MQITDNMRTQYIQDLINLLNDVLYEREEITNFLLGDPTHARINIMVNFVADMLIRMSQPGKALGNVDDIAKAVKHIIHEHNKQKAAELN